MDNRDRNPWIGVNMWQEFKYDLRHPGAYWRRGLAGIKGTNPAVPPQIRWLGLALIAAGALQGIGGVLLIVAAVLS